MAEIYRATQIADNLAKAVNKKSQLFLQRMEAVQESVVRKFEALLTQYAAQKGIAGRVTAEMAIYAKEQWETVMREAGYYDVIGEFMGDYPAAVDAIKKTYNLFDYKVKFTDVDRNTVQALMTADVDYFTSLSAIAREKVVQGIFATTLGNATFAEALQGVRAAIENTKFSRYAYTYANDAMMRFYRSVNAITAAKTGWDRYIYVGPIDGVTREFCLEHVGETLTMDEILALDNGQTGNVYTDGGGYNCRHQWVAVPKNYTLDDDEQAILLQRKQEVADAG